VLDEFSMEKIASSLYERLQDHYLKKSLANWLILKQRLFLLRMHEGTPIKSHIAEFFSIINDLDKIDVKIEYKDQALLLLWSLPSSYKSFKKAIIYGDKSIMKVNEHLLNKNKIDTQSTGESHHDDSRQVHYSRERSNNRSCTGNSKHRILTCNYYHKKRHIRFDCWLRKKKQPYANVTELVGGDKEQCDVLSVTDRSVDNKDRWVIDSVCSQHISSNRKMFSSYTSIQNREFFMGNSATSKVISEETIQFGLMTDTSLFFKAFVMSPNQGTISSLFEPYKGKSSVSDRKVI